MYALLLSIVAKHYNIGLLDRKFILYDNYQDVQAGFSHTKYQETVIRYHTSNKCIQHNERKKKSRRTYNDLNNKPRKPGD
jgi:uncharacterized protein YgiB involved in biofilm formation